MPDSKHESQDLEGYETRDNNDTLEGNPGDDRLEAGVVPPERWSAGMKDAWSGTEESESLDELLSEEEPDVLSELDDDDDERDENETSADTTREERDDDPDQRAGRLAAPSDDTDDIGDTLLDSESELYARDKGIDGGGASAEEAAVHIEEDPAEDAADDDYR
jgi:hypothetical protein